VRRGFLGHEPPVLARARARHPPVRFAAVVLRLDGAGLETWLRRIA
jgi:hypothetical protein